MTQIFHRMLAESWLVETVYLSPIYRLPEFVSSLRVRIYAGPVTSILNSLSALPAFSMTVFGGRKLNCEPVSKEAVQ